MSIAPHNKGGSVYFRNINAQIAGTLVIGAPCCLYELQLTNIAAATRFVKLYDKGTVGLVSDTPVRTIAINAGQSVSVTVPCGLQFNQGLSYRATTLVADLDATAPTANDVILSGSYAGAF